MLSIPRADTLRGQSITSTAALSTSTSTMPAFEIVLVLSRAATVLVLVLVLETSLDVCRTLIVHVLSCSRSPEVTRCAVNR